MPSKAKTEEAAIPSGRKPGRTAVIGISPEERDRETSLRERFARFWGTEAGTPRTIYEATRRAEVSRW